MEYTPGQEVEQLGLHVGHQVGSGGSLPLDLPGDGQAAARCWFYSAKMAILFGGDSCTLSKDLVLVVKWRTGH